jgi:cystathionine beta-lyase
MADFTENFSNDFIINHLGEDRETYLNAGAPPVFQSSMFAFPNLEAMRNALRHESSQPFYSRGTNPNLEMLGKKLAALEGGEACLLFASGSAAIAAAVCSFVQQGDHVVCVEKPYSWTGKLLTQWLSRFGVQTTFVDGSVASVEAAINPKTRVLYLETPNSVTFEIQDIAALTQIAKGKGIVSIVDNSYATPIFQKPLALGADISIHSASKYLSGHSDVVGGALICSAEHKERIFAGEFMTLGGIMSPMNAWLVLRGLRTLEIRLKKSHENGMAVARFLEQHPSVEKVFYPWLESHPGNSIARKQMTGAGGLLSVRFKSKDINKIEAFANQLRYFLLACSWGSYESLCFPQAALCDSANYQSARVDPSMFRLYCGLDEAENLMGDLERAIFLSGI